MLNRSPASRYPNTSFIKQFRGCGRYSTRSKRKWNSGELRRALRIVTRIRGRISRPHPADSIDPVSARLVVPAVRTCRKSIVGICGSFATANR